MPTARELLEQADALMRRNRTRQIDTEIPELTEVIAMPVIAPETPTQSVAPEPPAPAVALADIPELTDAVEEIEIASIVEIPDDDLEGAGWLRSDDEELAADLAAPSTTATPPGPRVPEPIGGRVLPLFAIAGRPHEGAVVAPVSASLSEADPIVAAMTGSPLAKASVVELPMRDSPAGQAADIVFVTEPPTLATAEAGSAPGVAVMTARDREPAAHDLPARAVPGAADDRARWEAIAEEIRMQVLQQVDIFTDTGLREQLSAHMQPIVERAGAEMVETINTEIGTLLRAYIADAIEREIEKWRESNA